MFFNFLFEFFCNPLIVSSTLFCFLLFVVLQFFLSISVFISLWSEKMFIINNMISIFLNASWRIFHAQLKITFILLFWMEYYIPTCFIGESESAVSQLCPTLCDHMGCSLPGSSVHGIFQAIVLEWIAISFSRGSSQPRDRTQVSRVVDRCFTIWDTREVLDLKSTLLYICLYQWDFSFCNLYSCGLFFPV